MKNKLFHLTAIALLIAPLQSNAESGLFNPFNIIAGAATAAVLEPVVEGVAESTRRMAACVNKAESELPGSSDAKCRHNESGYQQPEEDDSIEIIERSSASAKLRRSLNKDRVITGEQQPPKGDCDAHHIVPEGDNRPDRAEFANNARSALSGCVDINSFENGIFLQSRRDADGECESPLYHGDSDIHSARYYKAIADRLTFAKMSGGCQSVEEELGVIKDQMRSGVIP